MKVKRRIALVLLVIAAQISAILFSSNAWAASDYDSVVMRGGEAKISLTPVQSSANYTYYCGSSRLENDISTSWYTDIFKNSAAWYSDRWTPGYDQSVVDSFDAAKDSGHGWALVQHVAQSEHSEYSGLGLGVGDSAVYLMWSDDSTAKFVNDNASGSIQTPRLDMRGNWHVVVIEYQISGGTCKPMIVGRNSGSTPYYSYQTLAYDSSYALDNGSVKILPVFINFIVDYPETYAGVFPYMEYSPPTPILYPYTGTVDCGGSYIPQSVRVYQEGNNGDATLTYESSGRENWSYNLANSPYSLTVDCGEYSVFEAGPVNPWDTSTNPATVINNNWICVRHFLGPSSCSSS